MKARATALIVLAGLLLAACDTGGSIQQVNAQQEQQLNAISANTSEAAGKDTEQNGQRDPVGQTFRAGAAAPPRKY